MRGNKSKLKGEERSRWKNELKGWSLGFIARSFTDGIIDENKKIYYFNLFRQWSFENLSVNFEFCTNIFNYPPYVSPSIGNSVDNMTRSDMHVMHRPLEFAQFVGDCVGNIDLPTTYRRTGIRLQIHRWLWNLQWLFFNSLWNADGR